MLILKSILIFIIAGFCEVIGCFLIWAWMREGKPLYYGIFGFIILLLYGLISCLQTDNFARNFAAYGGFFIILSLLWAWKYDQFIPDKFDWIGCFFILVGVVVIFYAPRS